MMSPTTIFLIGILLGYVFHVIYGAEAVGLPPKWDVCLRFPFMRWSENKDVIFHFHHWAVYLFVAAVNFAWQVTGGWFTYLAYGICMGGFVHGVWHYHDWYNIIYTWDR